MPAYLQPAQPLTGRNDAEDGPSARRVHDHIAATGQHALLGFASDAGVTRNQGRAGAREAPAAIRQALAGLAAPADLPTIADLGDIVVDADDLEAGHTLLGEHVALALQTYRRVVVLGGGHETAFGSWSGLHSAKPDEKIGIINLDAHLDLRNVGNAGASSGTPFNQIRNAAPEHFDYLCIGVARESNTQALLERAHDWNTQIIFDDELLANRDCAAAAIQGLASRCDVIYLTIDMDVLPHYQAPGVSAPAVRGVPLPTIEHIVDTVLAVCASPFCALPLVDIVEVSPPHDLLGITARTAATLALRLLA
ncbi:MAG: formimidoylglutamase [Pseudomonadota bacterium]